jgi:hypothetical protein
MKKFVLVALFFVSVLSAIKAQFIELPSAGTYDLILVFKSTVSDVAIEQLRNDLQATDLGVTTPITRARVWRKSGPKGSTSIPEASYSISEWWACPNKCTNTNARR